MMRKCFSVLLLTAASLLLFGCPTAERGGASGNEIRVGEYGSLTGGTATFGQSTDQGVKLALDEINAAGGVKGKKLRLLVEDDQSKPEEAANAVTKLISQNDVVAIIGEVASSRSLAAAPICQRSKVPMITPSSTNPRVTAVGDYIFRVCYIDPYQGEALANFVFKELHLKKAAILRDIKNDYSIGLAEYFKNTFTKLGGQIVADQSYAEGDSDFRSQLTAVREKKPEVIFCPGYYTEMGQIAIQARDLGMHQPFVGGDGWESPKLVEIGGDALNGCYYSNHYFADDPSPAVRTFVANFQKRYNIKPDSLAALGYDAMKILAAAMASTKDLTKGEIRDQIAMTKDFTGVTGRITIGPKRDAVKPLVVLKIENKQLHLVAKVDPTGDITIPEGASTPTAVPPAGPESINLPSPAPAASTAAKR
jgi:branched-chain amino acid transport system substrate-binding protein